MRVVSRFDFLAGETSVNLSRAPNDTVMASMPNADAVDAYLCYHALEAVVDEAVNDAVLKQVTVRCTRVSDVTASITRGAVGRCTCMRMSMCMCVCAGPVRSHRDAAHEAQREVAAGGQRLRSCPEPQALDHAA